MSKSDENARFKAWAERIKKEFLATLRYNTPREKRSE